MYGQLSEGFLNLITNGAQVIFCALQIPMTYGYQMKGLTEKNVNKLTYVSYERVDVIPPSKLPFLLTKYSMCCIGKRDEWPAGGSLF